jgi:hypothetical protein
MPRLPSMKSKIWKLRRRNRFRASSRTQNPPTNHSVLPPVQTITTDCSSFTSDYRAFILDSFDPIFKPESLDLPFDVMVKAERKKRISGSLVPRILSWKGTSLSIFDKLIHNQNFAPSENSFEDEVWDVLSQFHDRLVAFGRSDISLGQSPFQICQPAPFLCGVPDFCLLNEVNRVVLVIEVKSIESPQEISRHFSKTDDSKLLLRKSSEYYQQIRAYLNICEAPVGLLLVKHGTQRFMIEVFREKFSQKEMDKLLSFFRDYLAILSITGEIPKLENGKVVLSSHKELENFHSIYKQEAWWKKLNQFQCDDFIQPHKTEQEK